MKFVVDADRATAEASPFVSPEANRFRFIQTPMSSVVMEGADMDFFNNTPDHAVNDTELPGQRPMGDIAREMVQAYTMAQVCVESRSKIVAYSGRQRE